MVNNCGIIIHKTKHKKGKRHDYDIYKKNHPATPKQVVNVFDLGYLGVGKDFPGQISSLPNKKKRSPYFMNFYSMFFCIGKKFFCCSPYIV